MLLTEIRGGRGPKDGSGRQLPLYDTPYEPAENGGDSGRESRLPQDDERPPEEYDQPWEWKKDRISKAFAGMIQCKCAFATAVKIYKKMLFFCFGFFCLGMLELILILISLIHFCAK